MTEKPNISKVIERIQCLLNLGRSPNPHEAEAAVAMAKKLMDDYRLTEADVSRAASKIQRYQLDVCRFTVVHRSVLVILEWDFNVRVATRKQNRQRIIAIYGTPADLVIAEQVYRTLLDAFTQRWKTRRQKKLDRPNFMAGLQHGVHVQLQRTHDARPVNEQNALMVIQQNLYDEIGDFMQNECDVVKTPEKFKETIRHTESYSQGFVEGLAIDVFQPCKGDGKFLPSM